MGVSPAEKNTQWITRLNYSGPEGDFFMVLIFRLIDSENYSIQAEDRLGRTWWELYVEEGRALSVQRRQRKYCHYEEAVEIAAVPLGPLEFTALPALILGNFPVAAVVNSHEGDGRWQLEDQRGRTWRARVEEGSLGSWTLYEGGQPSIWWSRRENHQTLSAQTQGLQLRWRNSSPRELTVAPKDLKAPPGFELDCSAEGLL